jgi:hypothetical protein
MSIGQEAVVQAPGDEYWVIVGIKMWEPAAIERHEEVVL